MKKKTAHEWIQLAAAACDHAGVPYNNIKTVTTWQQKFVDYDAYRNNAVFRLDGDRYLKLHGPNQERPSQVEPAVLRTLTEHELVAAPRYIASGHLPSGQSYLIMGALAGVPVMDVWDDLPRAAQLTVAHQIGALTAALHRAPTGRLAAVEQRVGGRDAYRAEQQAARIADVEQAATLSPRQRRDMLDYIHGEALELLDAPAVLTHSDFSHAHVHVDPAGARVTGFIDWGEAMLGPAEWDTTFHWHWTFTHDRDAMHQCLRGTYPDGRLPDNFARRCLARYTYTYAMRESWHYFLPTLSPGDAIIPTLIEAYFPAAVFGPAG